MSTLFLYFDDVDPEAIPGNQLPFAFSDKACRKLLHFWIRYYDKRFQELIIHCQAGAVNMRLHYLQPNIIKDENLYKTLLEQGKVYGGTHRLTIENYKI